MIVPRIIAVAISAIALSGYILAVILFGISIIAFLVWATVAGIVEML
jgi:hypothetical protein